MNTDSENLKLVRWIITLAKNLKMDAISEGVETQQQLQQLKALGCEFGQGYLFAKPLTSRVIESMWRNHPDSFWLDKA